jgi:xanthine dehydrogenase accessory factor
VWDWIKKLDELSRDGRPLALVTVTHVAGSTPCAPGAKMIVLGDGSFFGTVGGGHLEKLTIADAAKCATEGDSRSFKYTLGAQAGQCCGGVVELFVEAVGLHPRLYLFGAGHVAQALCRVLDGTPFAVHVVDERAEWLDKLPPRVTKHDEAWDDFARAALWDDARTYVAIMTHRHDVDQDIVAAAVRRSAKYIGLIGSKTKWEKFQHRLGDRGYTREELARVRCPIGLDIGGKAPQEVAVSIAAELLKVHHGR